MTAGGQVNAPEQPATNLAEGNWAKVIYVLYLTGLLVIASAIFLIGPIVGAVMAYVFRGGNAAWVESHYRFQGRLFWIAAAMYAITVYLDRMMLESGVLDPERTNAGGPVAPYLIVNMMYILVYVCWIVWCVIGLRYVIRGAPYP